MLWVNGLQARLGSATDGGIRVTVENTVNPLKKHLNIKCMDEIPGKDAWIAFQIISHAFAAANDCVIQTIRKVRPKEYRIELLIKNRLSESNLDPFVDEWKSNASKRKEAFRKFMQEKRAELLKEITDGPEPTSALPADIDLWCR